MTPRGGGLGLGREHFPAEKVASISALPHGPCTLVQSGHFCDLSRPRDSNGSRRSSCVGAQCSRRDLDDGAHQAKPAGLGTSWAGKMQA